MHQNDSVLFEFTGPWNVPIQINQNLIFLVLIVVGINLEPSDLPYALCFLAILLGSILLHEMGHAWGCLIQGIPVNRMVLHGAGGLCEHGRSTSPYQDELIVAMGPIVNLTLWAVASLLEPMMVAPDMAWFMSMIASLNLWLALFNLLPLMPLDGGRLMHVLLLRVLPARVATRICGAVGLVGVMMWLPLMAYCYYAFGFILLFFPPLLLHWHMLRHAHF